MNIYTNFLSKKDFKVLESVILSDIMPWYFNNGISKLKKTTNRKKHWNAHPKTTASRKTTSRIRRIKRKA
jgi:hypothetical protein